MGLQITGRNTKSPQEKAAYCLLLMWAICEEIVAARQMLAMSALGRQRPPSTLSSQRPLSGVEQTSKMLEIRDFDFR